MLRSNREEKFERAEPPHDTELTLGPAMLVGIACGLILLCGLCFGLGYTAGRHSTSSNATTSNETTTGQAVTAQPAPNLAKPPAKGAMPAQTVPQVEAAETPQPTATEATPTENPLPSNAQPASPSANQGPAVVKPALPTVAVAQPAKAANSAPLAPGAGTMVQIAAVSHSEDADVLMNALRKRGYTITARHLPGDNLIHVQIGPFANRSDANAMSQKLLSDGYNAVLMP